MKDQILEIIIGAFKSKLIASDMIEMNLIAKGIDEATKAHYKPIIDKQDELIKLALYANERNTYYYWNKVEELESELADLKLINN